MININSKDSICLQVTGGLADCLVAAGSLARRFRISIDIVVPREKTHLIYNFKGANKVHGSDILRDKEFYSDIGHLFTFSNFCMLGDALEDAYGFIENKLGLTDLQPGVFVDDIDRKSNKVSIAADLRDSFDSLFWKKLATSLRNYGYEVVWLNSEKFFNFPSFLKVNGSFEDYKQVASSEILITNSLDYAHLGGISQTKTYTIGNANKAKYSRYDTINEINILNPLGVEKFCEKIGIYPNFNGIENLPLLKT